MSKCFHPKKCQNCNKYGQILDILWTCLLIQITYYRLKRDESYIVKMTCRNRYEILYTVFPKQAVLIPGEKNRLHFDQFGGNDAIIYEIEHYRKYLFPR